MNRPTAPDWVPLTLPEARYAPSATVAWSWIAPTSSQEKVVPLKVPPGAMLPRAVALLRAGLLPPAGATSVAGWRLMPSGVLSLP